jgi:hypothetical protein
MHDTGNGREGAHGPRFVEDASGTLLESGVVECRFEPLRGGRLSRWRWYTSPPADALRPGASSRPPLALELVDPSAGALIDHFLPLGTRVEEFASGEHKEYGDFVEGPFRSQAVDSGGEIRIGLLRDGEIRAGKRSAEVRMAKSAAVRPGMADLAVLYRVINSGARPLQVLFAVEFNLYPPGAANATGDASECYYLIDGDRPAGSGLGSMGVTPGVTHMALANPGGEMALQLGWDREADLWRMPSRGGGAAARLLAVWRLQLPPRDNWAMGLWLAPS